MLSGTTLQIHFKIEVTAEAKIIN